MVRLLPPVEDFGALRLPLKASLVPLGTFALALLALALLERLGVRSELVPQAVIGAAILAAVLAALFAPSRRPLDFYAAGRAVTARYGGLATAAGLAGLLAIGLVGGGEAGALMPLACGAVAGLALSALAIAPGLRGFGGHSAGDFLAARFGRRARLADAAAAFAASYLLLTAALSAAPPLAASLADLAPDDALRLLVPLVILAVLPGGLRSLGASAAVQFAVILLGCLMPAAYLALAGGAPGAAPGLAGTLRALADPFADAFGAGALLPFLLGAAGIAALPQVCAQAAAATSPRTARLSLGWAALMLLALVIAALLLGRSFAALAVPADPGVILFDPIAATLLLAGLPAVLAGLSAAALLAALLAAAQAALFSTASALGHDLWDETLDRHGSAGRRIIAARLCTVAGALVAALCVPVLPLPPAALLGWALAFAAAGRLAPLILGLWWPRCTATGAATGAAAGLLVVLVPFALAVFGVGTASQSGPALAAAIGVAISFAATVGASLATAAPAPETEALLRSLRDPRRPALRERPA
jgi:cation/acetate symporter